MHLIKNLYTIDRIRCRSIILSVCASLRRNILTGISCDSLDVVYNLRFLGCSGVDQRRFCFNFRSGIQRCFGDLARESQLVGRQFIVIYHPVSQLQTRQYDIIICSDIL